METRFYQAQGLDIEPLALEVERGFLGQGYQVQHFGNKDHIVVQIKKGGDFAALVGMRTALTLTLQSASGGVIAVIGQQRWADKAAAGAVGMLILWPLAFTAGAGAIMQSNLASQMLATLDALIYRQQPMVQMGPLPPHLLSQLQQQGAPFFPAQQQASAPAPVAQAVPFSPQGLPFQPQAPFPPEKAPQAPPPPWHPPMQYAPAMPEPIPAQISCANCQALNSSSDTYCARCGQSLVIQKARCAECGAELKVDAAFCTSCGTSLSPPASPLTTEMTPRTQPLVPNAPVSSSWGYLDFAQGERIALEKARITIGRMLAGTNEGKPDINLSDLPEATTVSRTHALLEWSGEECTVTDLNSTNLTRLNDQVVPPQTPTRVRENDTLSFGKVAGVFHVSLP